MINTVIKLSYEEVVFAATIGIKRHLENRQAGKENFLISKLPAIYIDQFAVAGELAFCKLFNIFPNLFCLDLKSKKEGTDSGDVYLDNRTIDIKTTQYPNGELRIPKRYRDTKSKVDYYALITGDIPKFTFRGFLHRNEIFRNNRLIKKDFFSAKQEELREQDWYGKNW